MQKKIINGMETVNTIFEWNEDTKTLSMYQIGEIAVPLKCL